MVIPAYNAENYIARTVDNALAQLPSDLEIIVVDDGSIDSTSKIIDWYAEKYSNVVVIHKENGEAVAAQNTGIEVAKGENAVLFYVRSGNPQRRKLLKEVAKAELLCWGRTFAYEEYEKLWKWIEETF